MTRRQRWEQKDGKYQPVLLEEHILREIVERLWFQAKIKVWRVRERIPGKGRLSTPGIPDLFGWAPRKLTYECAAPCGRSLSVVAPVPLFIEVKRPKGVHRLAQTQFIREAQEAGCAAFFAESWADVIGELAVFGVDLKGE